MSELDKLQAWLETHGYKYEREDKEADPRLIELYTRIKGEYSGEGEFHQIRVYNGEYVAWDVICHYGSYGFSDGLLEAMGSIVDEKEHKDLVEGYLTAQVIINRLQ